MKLKLTSLLALTFLFFACTRTETSESAVQTVSAEKIKAQIAGAGFETRVQLFNLLSTKEKYALWQAHLLKARQQYANNGNSNAKDKIDELLANLTEEVFVKESQAAAVFSNYFMPVWNATAQKIFTAEELYDIGFDPSADTMGLVAPDDVGGGGGGLASCFCHVGTSGFSCRKIEVRFPSGVTIINGICERSDDCKGASSGCGWLWLQSCYGNHCNF